MKYHLFNEGLVALSPKSQDRTNKSIDQKLQEVGAVFSKIYTEYPSYSKEISECKESIESCIRAGESLSGVSLEYFALLSSLLSTTQSHAPTSTTEIWLSQVVLVFGVFSKIGGFLFFLYVLFGMA